MNRMFLIAGASAALAVSPLLHVVRTSANPGPRPDGLVAHEWGTFTSLQGSDGALVEGLHHTDELLPDFVHSRAKAAIARIRGGELSLTATPGFIPGDPNSDIGKHPQPDPDPTPTPDPWPQCHGKDCDFNPQAGTALGVTQKMETPVIYFYSAKEQSVHVSVGFPGGLITQWYPAAQSFSPPAGQVQGLTDGQTQWDVKVSPANTPGPAVPPGSIWAPSRDVPSDGVSAGGENEGFIFYRGLGRFSTPVQIRSELGKGIYVANQGDLPIADAFLIHVDAGAQGGFIQALGSVPAHGTRAVSQMVVTGADEPLDAYLARSARLIESALVRSGLTFAESRAMVNTWRTSYFKTPGLRVLYVLPRPWTDALLPLDISPKPQETVRTLVGRIEVLTADEELSLLNRLAATVGQPDSLAEAEVAQLGRFAEPKLRRELEVAHAQGADAAVIAQLSHLIELESDK